MEPINTYSRNTCFGSSRHNGTVDFGFFSSQRGQRIPNRPISTKDNQ